MAYINTWEQRGIDKGRAQGLQQGLERGLEQGLTAGRAQGEASLLERLLTRRFGPLPDEARSRLTSATPEQLQAWSDRILDAESLSEVFEGH